MYVLRLGNDSEKRKQRSCRKRCRLLGSVREWKKLQPKANYVILLGERNKYNIQKYTETNHSYREYYNSLVRKCTLMNISSKQKGKKELIVKFKVQSCLVVEREGYEFQEMTEEKRGNFM